MDGCSWTPSQATSGARAVFGGDMPWHKASNSTCDSDHLHSEREERDVVVSSQLQQQLKQIYTLIDMELEHELHLHHAVTARSPSQQQLSSPSSSLPVLSFAVISSDVTSSPVFSASSATTTFCQQPADASSLDTPFSPLPYSYLDMIPNLEEIMSQARHKDSHDDSSSSTSAFRQYVRHLLPKKKLKQGVCGQRAIKTAMSVLEKMHSARFSRLDGQSSSGTEMAAAVLSDESNNIQLQHVLSERKRREKINDSFDALRNVLPRSSKRDKTSILMRARDYINFLKSRVSELEEKEMALESQLWIDYSDKQDVNGSS